jgi:capsular polysaccharide transport system permease protein
MRSHASSMSQRPQKRPSSWLRALLFIVLPTVVSVVYFGFIAADRYVSEARFTLVKPASPMRSIGASLSFEEGTKGLGGDDSFVIRDYLQSRDALAVLLAKAGLRDILAKADRDPLYAFPGMWSEPRNEDIYKHLQSLLSVDYDSSAGITTVRVQAFDPVDAKRIADVLLDSSEALVNRLNERARGDAIVVAQADVDRARSDALAREDDLTSFRNKWSVVDPTALSQTVLGTIAALSLRLVEASAQLDVTVRSQPRSPQIAPMQARVRALQNQIERERSRLAGSDMSFAPRIAEYERLLLQRDFAAKSFVSALGILEAVKLDAERQQTYLARVVLPQVADKPAYPHRILWPAMTFAVGLVAFAMFRPKKPT